MLACHLIDDDRKREKKGVPYKDWISTYYRPDNYPEVLCAIYRLRVSSSFVSDTLRGAYELVDVGRDFGDSLTESFIQGSCEEGRVRFVPSIMSPPHFFGSESNGSDKKQKRRKRDVDVVRRSSDSLYVNLQRCGLKNSWTSTFECLVDQAITAFETALQSGLVFGESSSSSSSVLPLLTAETCMRVCLSAVKNIEYFCSCRPELADVVSESEVRDLERVRQRCRLTQMQTKKEVMDTRDIMVRATIRAVINGAESPVWKAQDDHALFGLVRDIVEVERMTEGREREKYGLEEQKRRLGRVFVVFRTAAMFSSIMRRHYDYECDVDVSARNAVIEMDRSSFFLFTPYHGRIAEPFVDVPWNLFTRAHLSGRERRRCRSAYLHCAI